MTTTKVTIIGSGNIPTKLKRRPLVLGAFSISPVIPTI